MIYVFNCLFYFENREAALSWIWAMKQFTNGAFSTNAITISTNHPLISNLKKFEENLLDEDFLYIFKCWREKFRLMKGEIPQKWFLFTDNKNLVCYL